MHKSEEIRPAHLVMWKNDRLGRNVMDVLNAKETIRAAGCRTHYIEGVDHNAERALGNRRKMFGFTTGPGKKHIVDPQTAPAVKQMSDDYARGKSMQKIADDLSAAEVRTVNDKRFTPKNLNKLLRNRAHIGEYSYAGGLTGLLARLTRTLGH